MATYGSSVPTTNWGASKGSNNLNPIIFGSSGLLPQFGIGTDGPNTFTLHINTSSTIDDSSFIRDSAWRKAYRFINRFDITTINIDRKKTSTGDESTATYDVARSFVSNTNSFELPIDHKSPCRFPLNGSASPLGSDPLIEMVYSMKKESITDDTGWNGDINDDGGSDIEWSIGSTGLRLKENSSPESIEFKLAKTGTSFQKIDTQTAIIPAYSGEIISFQDGGGFGYMGNVTGAGSKIFIDITQTDEILRWDPDDTSHPTEPHKNWLKTFSSIEVRNASRNELPALTFPKRTLEVVESGKDKYIVSFTSSSSIPITSWINGDKIRTEFKRKKTIVFGDTRTPWGGAEYENIRYRNLSDEITDDLWVGRTEPVQGDPLGACCVAPGDCRTLTQADCLQLGSVNWVEGDDAVCDDCDAPDNPGTEVGDIRPFTVSLNGTLDNGTITINYPDDINATDVKFEVYIEKDPEAPPPPS